MSGEKKSAAHSEAASTIDTAGRQAAGNAGSNAGTDADTPAAGGPARRTPRSDPYRAIFSCPAKGFELGEDRRFKQRVFTFKQEPAPEVVQRLKDAGYVYRPRQKSWTVAADPATRIASDALAREFAGTDRSPGRDR